MNELASRFHRLFAGTEHAHGTCDRIEAPRDRAVAKSIGGKAKKRIVARTMRQEVTDELWSQHLDGERNLGVIPLQESMLCSWGAIDVDGDVQIEALAAQVDRLNLPLIACRSKSGGAHLFLFNLPKSAESVQDELRYCAKRLGHPHAEVFPRQTSLDFRRGDLGSWLLMPYFNAKYTDRYAVAASGRKLSAVEFLEAAEAMREEF